MIQNLNNILTRPIETFSSIFTKKNRTQLIILACLMGTCTILNKAASNNDQSTLFVIILSIIFAPAWALVYLYITPIIFYIFSRLAGGKGNIEDTRYALIYSFSPILFSLILWIMKIIFFGGNAFTSVNPFQIKTLNYYFYIFFDLFDFVIIVWIFILYVIFNSMVNKFSILKSLLSVLYFIFSLIAITGIVYYVL